MPHCFVRVKYQRALLQALADLPEATRSLVIGYSGGRDSTVLLHAIRQAHPRVPMCAVHVVHHIEEGAEAWATHCARQSAALGVPFERLDVAVDGRTGGLEGAARHARYAALAEYLGAGDVLVCAHHARDQAETFLLQALRGAGVEGLAAMPVLAPLACGRLWRPWLAIDRETINGYAKAANLDWVEDGSNLDPRRARGFVRGNIWPTLEKQWPAAERTLSRSARLAAEASAAVAALARIDRDAAACGHAVSIAALAALSRSRSAAALRCWLADEAADVPDHRHLAQIQALFSVREHASPRVTFAASEVRRFDGRLFAMPRLAPPPTPGETIDWPDGLSLELPAGCGWLCMVGPPPIRRPPDLCIAFRAGGERLIGTDGRRKRLSERLRLARVPPWIRERMPLICAGPVVLLVPGRWRHPRIEAWFGDAPPAFEWNHALVGEPPRVVGSAALG